MSETEDYDKSATPTAHNASHQDGGADEINVDALEGSLAEAQISTWDLVAGKPTTFTPAAHKTSHQDAGGDEISVAGLSGQLADDQHIVDAEAVSAMGTKANDNPFNHDRYADSEALAAAVQSGAITDAVTKAPTHDAVYDLGVLLLAHKTRHQDAGSDEISVEGLAGELTAEQKSAWAKVSGKPTTFAPEAHHTSHEPGGADAIAMSAGLFDIDITGDLEPITTTLYDQYYELDALDDIMPRAA